MALLYQDILLPKPEDIKPLLFSFDTYQTYDLLFVERVGRQLQLIEFPRNFPNIIGKKVILIDRFTPDAYQWADGYSTQLYNFWLPFTGTDLGDTFPDYIPGIEYILDPSDRPDSYSSLYPPRQNYGVLADEPFAVHRVDLDINQVTVSGYQPPNLLLIETASSESWVITWLEWEDETMTVAHKRFKVCDPLLSSKITIDTSLILPCSMVIVGSLKIQAEIKPQLHHSLLYENLIPFLSHLFNFVLQLPKSRIRVMSEIKYEGTRDRCWVANYQTLEYAKADLPSWYGNYATLIYANNNYWKNGEVKNDLGTKAVYFYLDPYTPHALRFSFFPLLKLNPKIAYQDLNPNQELDGSGASSYDVRYVETFYGYSEPDVFLYPRSKLYNAVTKLQSLENELIKGVSGLKAAIGVYHLNSYFSYYTEGHVHELQEYDDVGNLTAIVPLTAPYGERDSGYISFTSDVTVNWRSSETDGDVVRYLSRDETIAFLLAQKYRESWA